MDQEQLKGALLRVAEAPLDFTLLFSGKKSKKINGLYKAESREIIIHNRNFTDENLLMYTAVHEYAHHLHACARGGVLSARSHSAEFWSIFHGLLEEAEKKGLYRNVFAASPELAALTDLIREEYLRKNGDLLKELGESLLRAFELCASLGGRFEDYLDRVLRIPRAAAEAAMKMHHYNINSAVGPDNMRFLAGIRNEGERNAAEEALLKGKSPDTVRVEAKRRAQGLAVPQGEEKDAGPRSVLEKEKARLERTIAHLSERLKVIERALAPPPP
ncbi:MAG: hypothetical protein LBD13_06965 [Spirochaetaceae bacterium]|jgi:hypothetical protein|nr:hypothetical protein [Spirochaetaceae bacterium]